MHIRERYSTLRTMHRTLSAKFPEAVARLPAFPKKYSLSRHTKEFFEARRDALQQYISAVASDPALLAVPCVQSVIIGSSVDRPNTPVAGTPVVDAAQPPNAQEYAHAHQILI